MIWSEMISSHEDFARHLGGKDQAKSGAGRDGTTSADRFAGAVVAMRTPGC